MEREIKVFGDPLERTWRACIFSLCGVTASRENSGLAERSSI